MTHTLGGFSRAVRSVYQQCGWLTGGTLLGIAISTVACLPIAVSEVAVISLEDATSRINLGWAIPIVGAAVGMGIGIWLDFRRQVRDLAVSSLARYRECPSCGADFLSIQVQGSCPECDHRF